VSECNREASMMRTPWRTKGCCAMGGGNHVLHLSPLGNRSSYERNAKSSDVKGNVYAIYNTDRSLIKFKQTYGQNIRN
jgi:hypothetical protein